MMGMYHFVWADMLTWWSNDVCGQGLRCIPASVWLDDRPNGLRSTLDLACRHRSYQHICFDIYPVDFVYEYRLPPEPKPHLARLQSKAPSPIRCLMYRRENTRDEWRSSIMPIVKPDGGACARKRPLGRSASQKRSTSIVFINSFMR
jgi:hypothetical protein